MSSAIIRTRVVLVLVLLFIGGVFRSTIESTPRDYDAVNEEILLSTRALQLQAAEHPTIKLVHVVPLFKVDDCSTFCPHNQEQNMTIASILRARDYLSKSNADVTLAASVFADEHDAVPSDFVRLPDLHRSTVTELELAKKLPFMQDIFNNLRSLPDFETNDYVIYTNADIIVDKRFYEIVALQIAQGYDAFTINRLTMNNKKKWSQFTALDLKSIERSKSVAVHPGADCFVMKRSIFSQIDMGDVFLGHPPYASVLRMQMISLAKNYKKFKSKSLRATRHLGDDRNWEHEANYAAINFSESYKLCGMMSEPNKSKCEFQISRRGRKYGFKVDA